MIQGTPQDFSVSRVTNFDPKASSSLEEMMFPSDETRTRKSGKQRNRS
jgi:hypothetical protein